MSTPDDSGHTERWQDDIADAKAAHVLEDRARAALLALPDGAKLLAAAMADVPRVAKPTRAGPANALRAAIKAAPCSGSKDCGHCLATRLIKGADGLYWQMVIRHDALIRKNTNIAAISSRVGLPPLAPGSEEWQDLYQLQRIGWYRGALRYDPDRGFKFITMAVKWGAAYVQNHRDRGAVRIPPDKARGVYPVASMSSLDDVGLTSAGEEGIAAVETLADPDSLALDEMLEDREEFGRAVEFFRLLSPRVRHVMEAIYLRGLTSYTEIGNELGATVADVIAMEAIGRDRLRRELQEDLDALPISPDDPEPIYGVQVSLFAA